MLTTAGETALAISLKVEAVRVPVSGALFIGGAATVWALDAGARSRRDASTMPTTSDVRTIGSKYKNVIFRLDIKASN
jgi:hypothetical protein